MEVTPPAVPTIHPTEPLADTATAYTTITNIEWWTTVPWEDIFTRPPTIVNLPPQCASGFTHLLHLTAKTITDAHARGDTPTEEAAWKLLLALPSFIAFVPPSTRAGRKG
jgi:hypothetical protein